MPTGRPASAEVGKPVARAELDGQGGSERSQQRMRYQKLDTYCTVGRALDLEKPAVSGIMAMNRLGEAREYPDKPEIAVGYGNEWSGDNGGHTGILRTGRLRQSRRGEQGKKCGSQGDAHR